MRKGKDELLDLVLGLRSKVQGKRCQNGLAALSYVQLEVIQNLIAINDNEINFMLSEFIELSTQTLLEIKSMIPSHHYGVTH